MSVNVTPRGTGAVQDIDQHSDVEMPFPETTPENFAREHRISALRDALVLAPPSGHFVLVLGHPPWLLRGREPWE